MTLKPCRIMGHELIINEILKNSTPANNDFYFCKKWWPSWILTVCIFSKLFKTYFFVFDTFKNIYIDINIVIL